MRHLKHGGGVVRTMDGICRLGSHLRAKRKQQFEIQTVTPRGVIAAVAKCARRCAGGGMDTEAMRGRAQWRTTARGAWRRPAHRRLKAEPLLLCERLKVEPTRKS